MAYLSRSQILSLAIGWGMIAGSALSADPTTPQAPEPYTQSLRRLVIPEVELREVPLRDALVVLSETAKRYDPTHRGFEVVDQAGPNELSYPAEMINPRTRVTIYLGPTRLLDVLQQVTSSAGHSFRIREKGIQITPLCTVDFDSNTMATREFKVPPTFVPAGRKADPKDPEKYLRALRADCRKFLIEQGVKFEPGASVSLNPEATLLTVHTFRNQFFDIESALWEKELAPEEPWRVPGPAIPKVTEGGRPLTATSKKHADSEMITREYLIPPRVEFTSDTPAFPKIPDSSTEAPSIEYFEEKWLLVVRHTTASHQLMAEQVEKLWRAYYDSQKRKQPKK